MHQMHILVGFYVPLQLPDAANQEITLYVMVYSDNCMHVYFNITVVLGAILVDLSGNILILYHMNIFALSLIESRQHNNCTMVL